MTLTATAGSTKTMPPMRNCAYGPSDSAGNDQLSTLKQANVGAINLSSVATPFDLKDSSNALLGQIRSSSVYLTDDGKAGTVQQVDLTV